MRTKLSAVTPSWYDTPTCGYYHVVVRYFIMKTIFLAKKMDCEGRSSISSAYFFERIDAENFLGWENGEKPQMSPDEISEIRVWESSEYNKENAIKERALLKLTVEERKLLGL